MTCPTLDELAAQLPGVAEHVAACPSCQLVREIIEHREAAAAQSDCSRFEALLALRESETIRPEEELALEQHLATCETCQAVSQTEPPPDGPPADHDKLPVIARETYVIGNEIGRGGMGRVMSARDRRIGRPVAIKEMLDLSPNLAARFEREARLTARLQHPGIVPVYEMGRFAEGRPFYAMPRLPGTTLREAISQARSLPERLALLPVVIAAAEAVAYAHSQRIVHRDLTPANILIGKFGETVVIDWGVAKDLATNDPDTTEPGPYRRGESAGLTAAGAIIGTAAYMPPEQAAGDAVDERADVYALGAILYHLLAGQAPYRAPTTEGVIAQLRAGPPPPAKGPAVLTSIVARAMTRDREGRYANAEALVEELKRFQTGKLVYSHEYSLRQLYWRWLRRRRGILITGALLLAGMIVLSLLEYRRIVRERDRANATTSELLEEQGRQELLAGSPSRALAFLQAAYAQGRSSAALRFMLAEAARDVEALKVTVEGDELGEEPLSPDGRRLATAKDGRVRIWDVATGAVVRTIRSKDGPVERPTFTPDGRVMVQKRTAVVLWEVGSDDPIRSFEHGHDLSWTTLTTDGTRLLTASAESAKGWEVASGKLLFTIAGDHLRGRFDRSGRRLALWSPDGVVRVHDATTGAKLGVFGRDATAVDLNPDGSRLVTGGRDGRVLLWDVKTRRTSAAWDGHRATVLSLHWPKDTRIVSSGADGHVRLWNATSGSVTATIGHGAGPLFAEVNGDGSRIATRGVERSVRLWSGDGGLLGVLEGPAARNVRFGRGGELLVTWAEGKAHVWNATGRPTEPKAPHRDAAVLSDDGTLEASFDRHGTTKVRDTRTGRDLFTLQETDYDVGFSHDGALFFTADAIKNVTRVWDWRSEKLLAEIDGAPERFTWRLQYETRTPEELARLVERHPWRLEGGRLVETRTR